MTKTLTEQWREGKLPAGSYFFNCVGGVERVDFFDGIEWARTKDFRIEEILAPVPAYNVWKNIHEQWKVAIPQIERLEKQLDIATKALNDILNDGDDYWDKDMEGVIMERKDGSFACFKKQSKSGLSYFNGTLSLDGKEYWISIFNSHTKNGEQYLSGSVQLK